MELFQHGNASTGRRCLVAIAAGCMAAVVALGAVAFAPASDATAEEGGAPVVRKYDTHVDSAMFDDPVTLQEYVANRE